MNTVKRIKEPALGPFHRINEPGKLLSRKRSVKGDDP